MVSFCKANNIHYLLGYIQISRVLGGCNGKEESAWIVLHVGQCPEKCEHGSRIITAECDHLGIALDIIEILGRKYNLSIVTQW